MLFFLSFCFLPLLFLSFFAFLVRFLSFLSFLLFFFFALLSSELFSLPLFPVPVLELASAAAGGLSDPESPSLRLVLRAPPQV